MNNLMELKQIFKKEPSILNMLNQIENYITKLNNIIQGERDIRLKVIEYIEEKWNKESYYDDIENCLKFMDIGEYDKEELLNILKGDDIK